MKDKRLTDIRVICANSRVGGGGREMNHLPHGLIRVCWNRT